MGNITNPTQLFSNQPTNQPRVWEVRNPIPFNTQYFPTDTFFLDLHVIVLSFLSQWYEASVSTYEQKGDVQIQCDSTTIGIWVNTQLNESMGYSHLYNINKT